jgi:hypothetical protein
MYGEEAVVVYFKVLTQHSRCRTEDKHEGPQTSLNSVALVSKRTIPTERPPLVGEVSANFCG